MLIQVSSPSPTPLSAPSVSSLLSCRLVSFTHSLYLVLALTLSLPLVTHSPVPILIPFLLPPLLHVRCHGLDMVPPFREMLAQHHQDDLRFLLPRFVLAPTPDTHPLERRSSICFLRILTVFAPDQ